MIPSKLLRIEAMSPTERADKEYALACKLWRRYENPDGSVTLDVGGVGTRYSALRAACHDRYCGFYGACPWPKKGVAADATD